VAEAANGGTDTELTSVTVTLAANVENLATTNAAGTGAINLTGNGLANTITGNAGNNRIAGGDGADVLIGGHGVDVLSGNINATTANDGDRDLFKFTSTADSGVTAATEDVIYGVFTGGAAGGDKIDISAVATGNAATAFTFTTGAFAVNHPGHVHVTGSGTTYLVSLNTDNDAAAEMSIVVHTSAAHTFTAGDFVL
jgi:serralysin